MSFTRSPFTTSGYHKRWDQTQASHISVLITMTVRTYVHTYYTDVACRAKQIQQLHNFNEFDFPQFPKQVQRWHCTRYTSVLPTRSCCQDRTTPTSVGVVRSCCQIIIYISINQSIYVSVYLFICLTIYLSIFLRTSFFWCPFYTTNQFQFGYTQKCSHLHSKQVYSITWYAGALHLLCILL